MEAFISLDPCHCMFYYRYFLFKKERDLEKSVAYNI